MVDKAKGGRRKGAVRRTGNAWHQGFAHVVKQRQPPGFDTQSEVGLTEQPGRVDLVIKRRPGQLPRHDDARVMRGLWPRLSQVTLLEFKGPTRGFRQSELSRLVSYGWNYLSKHWNDVDSRDAMTLALVVPAFNLALKREIKKLRCECRSLDRGYAQVHGLGYTTYIVVTDEVAEAEDDDYLRVFSHRRVQDPETIDWLQDWLVLQEEHMPQVKHSKSFQEMRHKLLSSMTPKERMDGLAPEDALDYFTPEQLLALLSPEERLRGLAPEQLLGLFTPEQIRAYLDSLAKKPDPAQ